MKKNVRLMEAVLAIALVLVFFLTACGAQQSKTDSSSGGKNFAVFLPHQGNEFMVSLGKEMTAAAEKNGVVCKVYSADGDAAKQIAQIDDAIAQDVDGLIIAPVSFDGTSSAIQACVDAKIPVITLHEKVSNQDLCNGHVGVNIEQYGEELMKECVKDLGGKGNVCIMNGRMGEPAQIALTEGFKKVISENPDINLILEGTGNWVKEDAITLTENWLSTGKEINAIICHNDGMGEGVMQVVNSANMTGKIKIYGTDAQPDALKGIKAGEYTATVFNDPVAEAEKGIESIIAVTQGKTIEKEVIIPSIIVNKDNIDKYLK